MSKELKLDENTMIVSETDTKGNIIYANTDFCKMSGYTKEQLIGNPHNMVRHKDMPRTAFADLWKTIKDGKTWNGIVKNETQDGNFYWVDATVYKVTKANGEERFISVRSKPSDEQINNATQLYKTLD